MNKEIIQKDEYKKVIQEIKTHIQTSQIKASISVNKELLKLYWNIAQLIVERQKLSSWGDGFIKEVSKDLQKEFPNIKGFSIRNLEHMRKWYKYWIFKNEITKQVVSQFKIEKIFQIPWGHNILIIQKIKDIEEAIFYINGIIENNWSRNVLMNQIEYNLYARQGVAITNFKEKLPDIHSDLAIQTLKDPYCFDFLTLTKDYNEKELEDSLVENITKFLLELGSGFSYVGRQYKLTVNGDDFYIDLLFYHVKLHSYVVVELKTGEFKPEYAGKLNFYVSVVDDLVATKDIDKPTIGILICKSKNDMVVEYALKDINKPMGISEYQLTQNLPKEFKSSLPSIEEIENELSEK
ncbi:MAG: PDDEXK nuclease domain-containing protein [Psychrilyobacter sp.]|uniref:PDDEXK nuclease domain-containing protein n=1 Tax=Psychrilyobacter sp. TaxID=2586924 RepID=UPI003C78E55A